MPAPESDLLEQLCALRRLLFEQSDRALLAHRWSAALLAVDYLKSKTAVELPKQQLRGVIYEYLGGGSRHTTLESASGLPSLQSLADILVQVRWRVERLSRDAED